MVRHQGMPEGNQMVRNRGTEFEPSGRHGAIVYSKSRCISCRAVVTDFVAKLCHFAKFLQWGLGAARFGVVLCLKRGMEQRLAFVGELPQRRRHHYCTGRGRYSISSPAIDIVTMFIELGTYSPMYDTNMYHSTTALTTTC